MKYLDVSTWQGSVDWAKVKANGVDGVFIRAGFGSNTLDNKFIRNISECNRLGIPCGVYWFSYALNADMAKKEAEYCLKVIEPYRVELPVCFDFEYDSVRYAKTQGVTVTKDLATDMVHAFCGTIEAAGYYAMNYANPDYLKNYFDDTVLKYDLWYAWYKANPNLDERPRAEVGIWQYSSTGRVDGIASNVDLNVAYKDYRTIIAKAGLNRLQPLEETPAPSNPEPIHTAKVYKTVAGVPKWYKPTIEKLIAAGALQGVDDKGSINVDETYCRVMTTLDRLGKLI